MRQASDLLRRGIRVHEGWIVLAILSAVGVAFFSLLRPGNNLGTDEWATLYHALQGKSDFVNHPLSLIVLTLTAPLFHANPIPYHALSITLWLTHAFLVYLIVRLLAPHRPLFAAVCAILYIVYFHDDFFMVLMFLQVLDVLTSVLLMLASLAAHFAYMRGDSLPQPHRIALLVISAVLAGIAPMVREATVPLLFGLPILIFLIRRRFDRASWIGLIVICGACFIASLYYLFPLIGLSAPTYGSSMLVDLDPIRMMQASIFQFERFLRPIIYRNTIRPIVVLVGVLAALLALALLLLVRVFPGEGSESIRQRLREHTLWIVGSLAAIWLGFAAYLPTVYAESTWRTHALSKPAEATLMASVIWLASDLAGYFITNQKVRWGIRYLGVLYIAIAGAATLARVQGDIRTYGGLWQDTGYFMHSLAEQVPDVENATLIIYMQVPDPYETPFTSGWGFQYAMRYFFEDRATGIIPIDSIFGTWEVSDDGILMTELWIEGSHQYGWDEIIVIARDDNKDVYILDTLPAEFYTPARQRQYDPHRRIVEGQIAARVTEAFGAR